MPQDTGSVFLSVIIPVFNEERVVVDTIRRVDAYRRVKHQFWEILIVDDGSSDRTASLVRDFIASEKLPDIRLISYAKNRGKGAAVRQGMLEARGEHMLLTDADLSSPIKEVDKLLSVIQQGSDIAIGSRAKKLWGSDTHQSFRRALSSRIFNFFVQFLVLPGIKDSQCGFKCFKKNAAQELFSVQKLEGFSFDVEILYLARKKGYKVTEVPVMWSQGKDSKVSVLRDSFRMLGDLFRIKKIHSM